MYFYNLLEKINFELVMQEYFSICDEESDCDDESDIKRTEHELMNALKCMHEIECIPLGEGILSVERVKCGEKICDDVKLSGKEKLSVKFIPWGKTLGSIVDEESLKEYGKDKFAALVLWEMTRYGFDEKTRRLEFMSW